ncbi:MAG: hypothetical protein LJE97_13640 [Betaproteobacteria bacterium]|jgi:hypothetical protein|nr:hypothetical protein [Betaproteobacteria bacterium]
MNIRITLKWWYWLAAVLSLGAWLAGWAAGLPIAFAAVGAQIIHFTARTGNPGAFPVQVPAAFLGLLALGTWPPFAFLHWLMLGGTSIRLLFDYCPLARTLSLAPWNRTEPLSWRLVKRTYLTPPVRGSFLERSQQSSRVTAPLPLRRAS